MNVQEQVLRFLKNVEGDMSLRMDSLKRTASHASIRSLRSSVTIAQGAVIGTLRSDGKIGAWQVMERGRKPGPVPRGFVKIIRQWIIDKGIAVKPKPYIRPNAGKGFTPEERGLRSLAGAIAYNIKKNGTVLHQKKGFDDIYTGSINTRLIELRQALSTQIVTEVKRINQSAKNEK